MTESETRRSVTPTFSLLNLLALTALIAIGTAVGLAYRKNRAMYQQRDELISLSSRLQIASEDELVSVGMPRVAGDFYSWKVHVPEGQDYELRLGIGAVSNKGIPPIVGSVRVAAGRHRVTLHTADSPTEEFRYVVYVDGKQAIEKSMGRDWIPGGWSSATGMSWPRGETLTPAPLQLSAKSYKPKLDFGNGHFFNGQSDDYVTRSGYRLWIDQPDRTLSPASAFIGFPDDPAYQGVGLRDGLRYQSTIHAHHHWTFTRPNSDTNDPVLRIIADFFADDGSVLSSPTPSFHSWQLRNDVHGENALKWQADPSRSAYSAFLQAKLKSDDTPQPIVEMKWETSRPDMVGLRLADTPANDRIKQWRLRILDGAKHLWRDLQIGDRMIKADAVIEDSGTKPSETVVILDLGDSTPANTCVRWQTAETLPLQVVERKQKHYAGMGLFNGLPLTFGIEIPSSLKPTLAVNVLDKDPSVPGNTFPGGAVFNELQIDLDRGQTKKLRSARKGVSERRRIDALGSL